MLTWSLPSLEEQLPGQAPRMAQFAACVSVYACVYTCAHMWVTPLHRVYQRSRHQFSILLMSLLRVTLDSDPSRLALCSGVRHGELTSLSPPQRSLGTQTPWSVPQGARALPGRPLRSYLPRPCYQGAWLPQPEAEAPLPTPLPDLKTLPQPSWRRVIGPGIGDGY